MRAVNFPRNKSFVCTIANLRNAMLAGNRNELNELVRAGTLLSREIDFETLVSVLVEQSIDITHSDLASLYLHGDPDRPESELRRVYRRGRHPTPERIGAGEEWVSFIQECEEAVVLLERKTSPFSGILLADGMQSGIALPLYTATSKIGVLVLNALQPDFYGHQRFSFLDSFTQLAGGLLHNARLFQELKEYLAKIEALERYQQNIFASMTNLLVTTDAKGKLRYFNEAAGERFRLAEEDIGSSLRGIWRTAIDPKIMRGIDSARNRSREMLGAEGIFKIGDAEIDFALNASPLKGAEDDEGVTLVFTDQSREKELQGQVEVVVEERRVIKDMFGRYLSKDIVQLLIDQPELIKPGGETKIATVLFADIRGYTSFSEGREPAEIITILNEYFTEAVEIIIDTGGYIDKFIGDAIMAAWGVPLATDDEEAIRAVGAAVSIQKLIASQKRKFFQGNAKHLRVGIGLHTGPLVAGNLGSAQRMDYTVIGDTVNVAARLEGIAKAGEVIITEETRSLLGDRFVLDARKPVQVKGKTEPIRIFAVTDLAG